ncbi:MAG TPA: helix-turn-helix transcriptional regulator [Terracidiphilus sp.]|nr:helix-turn-helix transcriptional regulator [Terracidiphilus sp.]
MRGTSSTALIEREIRATVPAVLTTLRELVGTLENSAEFASPADRACEAVLCDMELDGARYLLVRMPGKSRERLQLSPREHEIVRMVAKGHPNKIIADVLNISSWTVCTHLRRIFAKMGVGSRAAMVAQLLERGVVPADVRDLAAHHPVHSSDSR